MSVRVTKSRAAQLELVERGLFDPFADDDEVQETEADYWSYGARTRGQGFFASLAREDARSATKAETAMRDATRAGAPLLLVCRDVAVSYGGAQVLFGVDFDLTPGEIVALLGTNGAGKSTLLRALSGITAIQGGAILFDGANITHARAHERAGRGIVQTPGGRGTFPGLSVAEHLRLAGHLYRDDPEYVASATADVYGRFGQLRARRDEPAGNLSGGEQQMLTLGMALMAKPKLLLIDELALGLSPVVVGQLLDVVRAVAAQGTTIVIAEQSVNLALQIAERAVFMEKGEIRFAGPTAELVDRRDLLRAVFFQSSERGRHRAPATVPRHAARSQGQPVERRVVLDAVEVSVSYGGIRAVDRVSVQVREGEILGFIGPNGAGKTTLFDLLSGFVAPDHGKIAFDGADVGDLGPDQRAALGLGRCFQDSALFGSLSVEENLAVAFERHLESRSVGLGALQVPSVRRAERRLKARVDELVELFGLEAYRLKLVNELSTGTRSVVDIACATAMAPTVLLLDEPSSGVAQAETDELAQLLQRVNRETGAALLVIEHDIGLITSIADELVALDLGRLVTRGTPQEVLNHPAVVEAYLGGDATTTPRI